jgi:hypothetical protein
MSVETGQLRCWTAGHKLTPFLVLKYDEVGAGAWWILEPTGIDWFPNDEIEEYSESIDETG